MKNINKALVPRKRKTAPAVEAIRERACPADNENNADFIERQDVGGYKKHRELARPTSLGTRTATPDESEPLVKKVRKIRSNILRSFLHPCIPTTIEERSDPDPNPATQTTDHCRDNIVYCREKLFMRKNNYLYFVSTDGNPLDEGARQLKELEKLPRLESLELGETQANK